MSETARDQIDGSGTARARCVLALNPSLMTLDGTNTWLIAEPGAESAMAIDPGPDDAGHLQPGQADREDRADPRPPGPLGRRPAAGRAHRRPSARGRPGAPPGPRRPGARG